MLETDVELQFIMPSDMIGISAVAGYSSEWLSIRYSLKPEVLFSDLLKFANSNRIRFVVQSLHNLSMSKNFSAATPSLSPIPF